MICILKYTSVLPHIKSVSKHFSSFNYLRLFYKILNIYFIEHRKYFTGTIALKVIKDFQILSGHGLVGLSDCMSFTAF